MKNWVIKFIATGFGAGYAPKMPGTFGSVLGVGVWLLIQLTGNSWAWIVLAAGVLPVIWIAGRAERLLGRPDPPGVVIDEIVGMPVALAGIAPVWWLV